MTAGFVGFGVLMPLYARELGRALGSPGVRAAVVASGLGTLAVAAFPVTAAGGTRSDTVHYIAAAVAYVADVVAPLVAAGHLRGTRAGRASAAVAVAVAVALVGSLRMEEITGLLQRSGLTLYDAWAVALAVHLLAGRGPTGI
jgi:AcrR family transcriptional regulator